MIVLFLFSILSAFTISHAYLSFCVGSLQQIAVWQSMKLSVAPLLINASASAFPHACTKSMGTSIAFSLLLMYNLLMCIAIA